MRGGAGFEEGEEGALGMWRSCFAKRKGGREGERRWERR